MTNPIEVAVAPLKETALVRAEKDAKNFVEKIFAKLAEVNNDMEMAYPYPKDCWAPDYKKNLRLRATVSSLIDHVKSSRRINEPDFVVRNDVKVAAFVERAKEFAGIQYDEFVVKLVNKIGEVTDASLDGDHVWGYSVLTVTKTDGTKEKWKTQQIVNVSKLGLLFNQWPSRKMK